MPNRLPTGDLAAPILEMRSIDKRFPGVVRSRTCRSQVMPGEIHALIGENGAGKSTLIKILAGAYQADAGEIRIDGETVDRPTPLQMIERGIAVIYQETMLAPHLSVAENLFLGRLPRSALRHRRLARGRPPQRRRPWSGSASAVDPDARIADLSVAQRQMVEIAGALSRQARIVVLDEPSAVLGGAELEKLFEIIRRLPAAGRELHLHLAPAAGSVRDLRPRHRAARRRRRRHTSRLPRSIRQTLIGMMVGRRLADIYPRAHRRAGDIVLAVEGLDAQGRARRYRSRRPAGRDPRHLRPCRFRPHRTAARAGWRRLLAKAGVIACAAGRSGMREPRAAIREGMSLLPEDRKSEGCFLPQSVAFNVTISGLNELRKSALLSARRERDVVGRLVRRLAIRTPGTGARIESLSGGNQQKCMIARSLNARCAILLFDEPTRGVDVGAKREIYQLLARLADEERAAIVMVSSELPEILGPERPHHRHARRPHRRPLRARRGDRGSF